MQTIEELKRLQSQPLDKKITMTEQRIRQWVHHYGEDGVYISFSGGKDSTVLLHIARRLYPNIKAMFVDVPTQYPELKQFAQKFENLDITHPKTSFMGVCEKYGFPLISKDVSQVIYESRHSAEINGVDPRETSLYKRRFSEDSEILKKYPTFSLAQWDFMFDSEFAVSHKCCVVMKKKPSHDYEHETKRLPILGTMACESKIRSTEWVKNGCNAFESKRPSSKPMSFWTENDVLEYIVKNDIEICSVYGDIVEDYGKEVDGQMSLADFGCCAKNCKYKCKGVGRTGCVCCGFGAHLDKKGEGRFEKIKMTHPKIYGLLDVIKNNGVTYRQAIEWMNERMKGKCHIQL